MDLSLETRRIYPAQIGVMLAAVWTSFAHLGLLVRQERLTYGVSMHIFSF